jgi:hypothetical protein
VLLRWRVLAAFVCASVLGALAANVTPARAGLLSCSGGTQVFAPWGDYSYYYPVTNGGFELGSTGWTLTGGATIVTGNEPFYRSGSRALSLPDGSSATSPQICIGLTNDFVRMFASDVGGRDRGLRVRITWYGLLSKVLGTVDFATFTPGGPWAPSVRVQSLGGIPPLVPPLGSTSARIQLTPIGSGSNWLVDDLFVDPFFGR